MLTQMSETREEHVRIVETYLRAIEDKDVERVRSCLHPDFTQHEYPNRLVTAGASRDITKVIEGLARGAKALTAERYEIEDASKRALASFFGYKKPRSSSSTTSTASIRDTLRSAAIEAGSLMTSSSRPRVRCKSTPSVFRSTTARLSRSLLAP